MLTPLHAAAKGGTVESIEALVAAGGSLEARLHLGERGATPLHVAASRGRAKVVEALLAAGSSPEAQTDEGATPLVEAAARGHAGVVSALEAASVNFSQTNASCANSTPTEVSPAQLPTQLPFSARSDPIQVPQLMFSSCLAPVQLPAQFLSSSLQLF